MKIGILANTFERGFGGLAGGHVHFIEVAKRWENVEVCVFAPEIARATIARELPAATFVAMPSGDGAIGNRQLKNLYRTFAGFARRRELRACDALIASSHFLPDVVPALMSSPRRTVVSIHHILTQPSARAGLYIPNAITAIFQAIAFYLVRTFAAAVLVYARDVADRAGIDGRRTRVFLMSNGANSPFEANVRTEANSGAVYLGRLVPTKGIEDVLRAWALVARDAGGSLLTIAGAASPDYRAELERLAGDLGIANSVRFLGSVSESEKSRILHSARVFTFASKEEGWGIVLAEAMRHGLPCLTYDLPAYRGIFTRGRISVAVGDIRAFADCLRRFLTDDVFQRSIASEAIELASTFTWEHAARLEAEALEAIVRRRRVGIISNSFVSEAAAVNGGFIHVLEVAKRWHRWEVVFFAPESARALVARELPNATFVPASPRHAPGWLRGAPLLLARLFLSFTRARELRACDAVVTSTPFLSDVLPTVFARRGRVALIVQHLQTAPWKRPGSFLANAVAYTTERLGLLIGRSNASLWLINDPAVAERLSLAKRRAAVVQMAHGVDHLEAADFKNESRTGALYVGRLHPTKGLDDLLKAWRVVITTLPDAQLRIIGTGSESYRANLQSMVEELDLSDHVRFLGAVDETTKARELGRARVFAFPSLEEGWGIALAEAMTFAVPCVTYDLSAYRAVFTAGRIEVRRRDIGAFASALLELFQDDHLWSRLSNEGAALAKTFTWDRAAKVEEDAMTWLIDRRTDATSR